ncbi:MAG: DsbA family protein [Candidatus Nanohaloarchaea archaeon]
MGEQIEISVRQAMVGVFVLGLAVGFSAGVVSTSTSLNLESGTSSESSLVELEDTEYPYSGVEAGIASGNNASNSTYAVEGEPYLGSGDIRMIAYEDFECPFCSRFHSSAFPKILDNHIRTGEATLYFKNYPLQRIHPWSARAAAASECALNQDAEAYWTFNRGFFDNQNELKKAHKAGKFDESMKRWAEQTGLDVKRFSTCYDSDQEMEEVREDARQGGRLGTPTVFVEDTKISGAQPYAAFRSVIEEAGQ